MRIGQEKRTLPGRRSQAYSILSLIAISGELPANQIPRLSGGQRYKEEVIKTLRSKGLIQTYYKDKLRGHRLTVNGKQALSEENPDRFKSFLTGNTDTNQLKYAVTRRLRLHSIAETTVTMRNVGISVFVDEKLDVFFPTKDDEVFTFTITTPAFYSSREIKELGEDAIKIRGSRTVGVLLTNADAFIVYNTGVSMMKWENKSEWRVNGLMTDVLCRKRFPRQYRIENIRLLMFGGDMEQAYQLMTSKGGSKNGYFTLDKSYNSFIYLTSDHYGEVILKLLCDTVKTNELNRVLSENLSGYDERSLVENDAIDENGEPVLFAYDCDMPRIIRFNDMLQVHKRSGTIICFDFQAGALRRFCCENVRFQTIDFNKFERGFFP